MNPLTAPNLTTPHGKSGPKNPKWPAEHITELKGYLVEGMSAGLIGQRMKRSRNAVCGAIHRLGLSDKASPRRPSVSKRATTSAGRKRRKPTTEARIKLAPAFKPTEATEIAADFAPPNPVRLIDAVEHVCRWPLGNPSSEMLVCGERTRDEGCPYCRHHALVAYVPSKERKPWVPGRVGG